VRRASHGWRSSLFFGVTLLGAACSSEGVAPSAGASSLPAGTSITGVTPGPIQSPPVSVGIVTNATCGNGRLEPGENCDDGNRLEGDGCSACCDEEIVGVPSRRCAEAPATCGNGRIDVGEVCDDGNAIRGDGCSNLCNFVEPGFECLVPAEPCRLLAACGDGVVSPGEACEPSLMPTGCSLDCQIARHFTCASGACSYIATCGNGLREGYETCDDGNRFGGDGCSAVCAVEEGWHCLTPGSPCMRPCASLDSPTAVPSTGAPADPTPLGKATAPTPGGVKPTFMAAGVLEADAGAAPPADTDAGAPRGDASAPSGDDDAAAPTPPADAAGPAPLQCLDLDDAEPFCGDGRVDPGEDCDNGVNADPYYWEDDDCAPGCRWPAYCGDGQTDLAYQEECDPGDEPDDEYGCTHDCTLGAHCGDGILQPQFEACDDGNVLNGDDCRSNCALPTSTAR